MEESTKYWKLFHLLANASTHSIDLRDRMNKAVLLKSQQRHHAEGYQKVKNPAGD